jgi:hypothetical protein
VGAAVVERAGMTSSGFVDMRDAVPDVAEGWDPVTDASGAVTGWRQNIYSYPPIGSPDGGAHATAADLVRLLTAVRAGDLLSPESTRAFCTPQVHHHDVPDLGAVRYGLGPQFLVRADGRVRSMSKTGINAGASAILRYHPLIDTTLALVSNSESGVWTPLRAIDALLHPRNTGDA